jgi:hypothetical protein
MATTDWKFPGTVANVADSWNAGLTQSDIVDTDFGIDFEANGADSLTLSVDSIKIRVTYTESGSGYSSPFPSFRKS